MSPFYIFDFDERQRDQDVYATVYINDYTQHSLCPMIVESGINCASDRLWFTDLSPKSILVVIYRAGSFGGICEYGSENIFLYEQTVQLMKLYSDRIRQVKLNGNGTLYLRESQTQAKTICAMFTFNQSLDHTADWYDITGFRIVAPNKKRVLSFLDVVRECLKSNESDLLYRWIVLQLEKLVEYSPNDAVEDKCHTSTTAAAKKRRYDERKKKCKRQKTEHYQLPRYSSWSSSSDSSSSSSSSEEDDEDDDKNLTKVDTDLIFRLRPNSIFSLVMWHYLPQLVNLLRKYDISFALCPKNEA